MRPCSNKRSHLLNVLSMTTLAKYAANPEQSRGRKFKEADLSVARCYLSFLLIEDREAVMDQIELQNKAIRNALANRIRKQVRIIPNLVFFLDDTAAYAAKIEALFEGLVIPPAEGDVPNRVADEID